MSLGRHTLSTKSVYDLWAIHGCDSGKAVLGVIRDQNNLSIFSNVSKNALKLSLLPPSKYTKTLLHNHLGIQIK